MKNCHDRISLFDVEADVFTEAEFLDTIVEAACNDKNAIVGNHNLHSIYTVHHDERMRDFYTKAKYIYIDGMPIVWAGKLLSYDLSKEHRLTSLDWIVKFLKLCAIRQLNVYFLGSLPGVAEKACGVFLNEVPGLKLAYHHGHFDKSPDSQENEAVIKSIVEFETNVLLVGMGMPIQENWIADNIERLNVNVAWALGAFMDYYAGVKPVPPRWMGRLGLEWLSRLCCEPKRLWRRYLIEPWFVLRIFLPEFLKHIFRISPGS